MIVDDGIGITQQQARVDREGFVADTGVGHRRIAGWGWEIQTIERENRFRIAAAHNKQPSVGGAPYTAVRAGWEPYGPFILTGRR
jgi:hypothetical protein